MQKIIAFVFLVMSDFLTTLWYGYSLSVMWRWFVMKAFHVAPISIAIAIGLSLVVQLFTYRYVPEKKNRYDEEKDLFKDALMGVTAKLFYPALVLLAGYAVLGFVK